MSSTPNRDSNLNLPVIGILVYCAKSALDHVATKLKSLASTASDHMTSGGADYGCVIYKQFHCTCRQLRTHLREIPERILEQRKLSDWFVSSVCSLAPPKIDDNKPNVPGTPDAYNGEPPNAEVTSVNNVFVLEEPKGSSIIQKEIVLLPRDLRDYTLTKPPGCGRHRANCSVDELSTLLIC
uniref:Uncharacterized protein n=1 Tax=Timema douglasi TaxID=61478 RepID=A0A7R8VC18_TIMDO|nr:unnamed protein product [Timema douglasi]